MPSNPGDRDSERVIMLGDLRGEILVFEPLLIKEISHGGCSVETHVSLHLNSLHDLRLTLGGTSVVLKGRVVHSRISDIDQDIVTYRTGIEFVEPTDRIAQVIAEFIAAIGVSRRGM